MIAEGQDRLRRRRGAPDGPGGRAPARAATALAAFASLAAASALAGCAAQGPLGPKPTYVRPDDATVERVKQLALDQSACLPVTIDKDGKSIEPPAYQATIARYGRRIVLQHKLDVDAFYPPREQSWGVEGFALLQFDIETTGAVTNPRVLLTSPLNTFETESVQVLKAGRFEPIAQRCANLVEQITFRLPR